MQLVPNTTQFIERSEDVNIVERFSFYLEQEGVSPHRYQANKIKFPLNEKKRHPFL
jgi:hypothetical protein